MAQGLQHPWGAVTESIQRLRELLEQLQGLQEELTPSRFPPGKEATVVELTDRVRKATKEVALALRFADSELRQIALSEPESPLALDLLRDLLRRARGTVFELESSWSELDQTLTDYVVERELLKPAPEQDFWKAQWGPDSVTAKEVAEGIFQHQRGRLQRDRLIFRLKYERGYTQQQIADLLNMAQSTVATRLARIDDEIATLLAPQKVAQVAAAQGFQVEFTPSVPYIDFVVERDGLRIAVDARPCSEEGAGRRLSRLSPDFESLVKIQRMQPQLLADARAQQIAIALYFRRDGAVAFYKVERLVEALQASDDLSLDSVKRGEGHPAWSFSEFLEGGA